MISRNLWSLRTTSKEDSKFNRHPVIPVAVSMLVASCRILSHLVTKSKHALGNTWALAGRGRKDLIQMQFFPKLPDVAVTAGNVSTFPRCICRTPESSITSQPIDSQQARNASKPHYLHGTRNNSHLVLNTFKEPPCNEGNTSRTLFKSVQYGQSGTKISLWPSWIRLWWKPRIS
jgi:hypothetical protein